MSTTKATLLRWGIALVLALGSIALVALWIASRHPSHVASTVDGGAPIASSPRGSAPAIVASRPRASVAGRVLDPSRKALANASVCAFPARLEGLTTPQRAPRCTTTDTTGAFKLADLFAATPLTLTASAESFPPEPYHAPDGAESLRLNDGEQRTDVDFVLRAGAVLVKGTVDDVTGGVVAGATVVSGLPESLSHAVATSDAKGEFALWVDPGSTTIQASAPGYAPGIAFGPAPGHVFAIHLVPGSTLVGRAIVAGAETPVAGAFIEAIQMEGGYARASTRTDDDGRFKVDGLVPGRYRIEATSEAREGYSKSSVTIGMGETSAEVVVAMDPAFVVMGKVMDVASGKPCSAGQVTITDRSQNEYSQGSIEPDGSVRMASVIPGKYKVEIECKGMISKESYPEVLVRDRDPSPVTWAVERGAAVVVEVFDGEGKRVTRASVDASALDDKTRGSGDATDRSNANGEFELSGLKPGSFLVSATTPDGAHVSKPLDVTPGRADRVRLELPSAGVIEGTVEDDDHRPVPHVRVFAYGERRSATQSLDDGTFVLRGLPSGDYELEADREGRGSDDDAKTDRKVKVTIDAPKHVKAKIVVERHAGAIEGRVVDAGGHPIIDAFVDVARATGSDGNVPRWFGNANRTPIVSDTDGHFRVDRLADGEYNLRAYRKGGGEATASHVKVGTKDVSLRLADGASIEGTLTAGGKPVERFDVVVRSHATGFARSELFFHAGGAFAIRDVPPGDYDVDASTPDGIASTKVTVAEGEKKTVALVMALRGTIEGRLVDAETGAPLAGYQVDVGGGRGVTDERAVDAKTGDDGHFHLEGVLAGARQLIAFPPNRPFEPRHTSIVVDEGGGTTMVGTLRLPKSEEN